MLVYKISSKFPVEERYTLTSQLRRSAISISANIAEGKGRNSDKELSRFLYISRGSLEENKSHLLIAKGLGFINETDFTEIEEEANTLGIALNSIIKTVKFSIKNEQSES